jgi:hypothetical protein
MVRPVGGVGRGRCSKNHGIKSAKVIITTVTSPGLAMPGWPTRPTANEPRHRGHRTAV